MANSISKEMIAPCGMDCALCIAHQRGETKREKHCEGCNNPGVSACTRCTVRRCPKREESASGFCYECARFPCKRISQLDARYRKNYQMSVIGNLEIIRRDGLAAFIEHETKQWTCPTCGGLLCVHRNQCLHCKTKWR